MYCPHQSIDHLHNSCKVYAGLMSQDAATTTVFSNVNNPLFRSNFPSNNSILINIVYQIITIPT